MSDGRSAALGTTLSLETIAGRLAAHAPTRVPDELAPRRAAVAQVLRPTPRNGLELLFIRRVEQEGDPWSGQMAFPGGHVDDDDPDAVAAAVREAEEEVGLVLPRDARLLGRLDEIRAVARGRLLPMAITPVAFALEREVTLQPEPTEVADTMWVALSRLTNGKHLSTIRFERDGNRMELPCWRLDGACIWGLTYLMTRNLLHLSGLDCLPDDPRRSGVDVRR